MKIQITDIAWGIDRVSGERLEKTVAAECFELSVGTLQPIGPALKRFEVTAISQDAVTIVLNPKGKTATLKCGESYVYRPLSMDGGHYYTITIT